MFYYLIEEDMLYRSESRSDPGAAGAEAKRIRKERAADGSPSDAASKADNEVEAVG